MNDRIYRVLLGLLLLVALSFDLSRMMYVLIAILLFEGLPNLRIPLLVHRLRPPHIPATNFCAVEVSRFHFEAERAWRLLVGILLLLTYVLFYQSLWFFPWFLGFTIIGAGMSGICPMEFSLKRIGFK